MNDLRDKLINYFDEVLDSTLGHSKLLNDFMKRFDKSEARNFRHVCVRNYITEDNEYSVQIILSIHRKKHR